MIVKEGFYKCRNGMKAEVLKTYESKINLSIGAVFDPDIHIVGLAWHQNGRLLVSSEHEYDLVEPWVDKIKIECEGIIVGMTPPECNDDQNTNVILKTNRNTLLLSNHGKRFKVVMEEI